MLDQWGNKATTPTLSNDIFDFIRIEDVAYDKRSGKSNVVYMADSGRASSGAAAPLTKSTNGRVWKLELDPNDPSKGKLSVLIQGDDQAVKDPGEIHQPDNLETTANGSLLVQEDPSSGNQFAYPSVDPNRTSARSWRYNLGTSAMSVVARIATDALNQKNLTDEDAGDLDPADNPPFVGGAFPVTPGNLGAWESSGIVDASSVFGDGAFLIDVQAHTYWVDTAAGVGFNYKREGGQLLLLKLPGV